MTRKILVKFGLKSQNYVLNKNQSGRLVSLVTVHGAETQSDLNVAIIIIIIIITIVEIFKKCILSIVLFNAAV